MLHICKICCRSLFHQKWQQLPSKYIKSRNIVATTATTTIWFALTTITTTVTSKKRKTYKNGSCDSDNPLQAAQNAGGYNVAMWHATRQNSQKHSVACQIVNLWQLTNIWQSCRRLLVVTAIAIATVTAHAHATLLSVCVYVCVCMCARSNLAACNCVLLALHLHFKAFGH